MARATKGISKKGKILLGRRRLLTIFSEGRDCIEKCKDGYSDGEKHGTSLAEVDLRFCHISETESV
jgi:hypothetical protein